MSALWIWALLFWVAFAIDCVPGTRAIATQRIKSLGPDAYIQTARNHHDYSDSFRPQRFVGKKVLDAGAGQGMFVIELRKMGVDATALDARIPPHVKQSSVLGPNYIKSNMQKTPFPDDTFDYIISAYSIFSAESDNRSLIAKTLREFHRVLKPGGMVLLEQTNADNVKAAMDPNQFEIVLYRRETGTVELRRKD